MSEPDRGDSVEELTQSRDPHVRAVTVGELLDRITPHAWVTQAITGLIVLGFVAQSALGVSIMAPTAQQLLAVGAEFGPAFAAGEWWRAITSMFLHAGPIHLAFNLWAFWSIGQLTERVFGNKAFFLLYLVSGICGSLVSLVWKPLAVGVGASGAIFGVYGAFLAFVMRHRGVFPPESLTAQRNSIIGFIGYNVVFGLSQKNTDMAAHFGGFVAGGICGLALTRDLLRPSENAGRRALAGVVLCVAVVAAAISVRAYLLDARIPAPVFEGA